MRQPALAILALLATACQLEPASNLTPVKVAAPKKGASVRKERISLADYSYLRIGMLRNEAEEIMMTPGIERGSSQLDSVNTAVYEWSFGTNGDVTLRFQNGKLTGKSQYGLR